MLSGTDCEGTNGDGFSDELTRLKRQGASVLVVGSVQPDQRRDTCQRLLGCGASRVRRRVLVSTTGEPHPVSHFVDDGSSETLSVIAYNAQARSAAATAPDVSPSIEPSTTDVDTLADLGIAISSAIESFEATADVLEPSEVRVGINSLLPLLEEYGRQRMFKFLHLINGRTRTIDGMVHYHLPVERDAQVVPVLSPLFDVVVELREQNGDYQERWDIDDGAYSSGWLPVDSE
ncbi:hypothetical protein CP556_06085 [Natrinema sp. CBA1119]|jgi:hypothetical protein|uniref:DUF7504 family protein n=1 Tax=Natrinema sp. CBA1119 TaxID=1608465 RepID=UPI000BFAAA20|nr:hypothetical protein [Natrinema sp. CBA1119]PGF15728.1 hypothetical protein CP556_06085 [Natrinema sp. CBA1119]